MRVSQREQPLILIVDHEQTILDELAASLAASGYTCRCCTTASAAVYAAEESLPDLIISDVSLQDSSGREMYEQIRQHEALAEVPVMFLSAGQMPDIIRRSDGSRGIYYLRKPLDQRVLLDLIGKVFAESSLLAVGNEA